jgi:TonB family protein
MRKVLLALVLTVLCFAGFVFAQAKKPKVLKYFAPQYPPAPRAVRATGEVVIAVKIDKSGKVTEAKVESGHPLLRATCEILAKDWVFSADESEAREARITFAFEITNNASPKNNYRATDIKTKFRKPYRLEIKALMYPRIDY